MGLAERLNAIPRCVIVAHGLFGDSEQWRYRGRRGSSVVCAAGGWKVPCAETPGRAESQAMPADPPLLPLLEDDLAEPGLITPIGFTPHGDVPRAVVICFFAELIEQLAEREGTERIGVLTAAHGEHQVLSVAHGPGRVTVFHPGVGAPIAAAFLEEVIAAGGGPSSLWAARGSPAGPRARPPGGRAERGPR